MKRTFFVRYALLIVCAVCFLGPFALRGARMSMQRVSNRLKDWLPSDYLETAELEWFGRHFMGEQFVIVTWPGCSEDDPRYRKLVERIGQELAPAEALDRQLMGRPLGRLRYLATVECGISDEELKLGGPPMDNVAIDEEGQITLARLIVLSAMVGIGMSLFLVRSVRVTCILFFIGGLAALSSLAIVWWSGGTVDAIMMSMPSLVYVLAISGALHLVNYYRETVQQDGLAGSPERMIQLGARAALLCSVSTALGLVSLSTSTLVPIRNFGIYSVIGVLATCALFFTFLPASLQLWPPRSPNRSKMKERLEPTRFEQRVEHLFERMGGFIIRRWGLVTLGCVVVIVGCSAGLFRMQTSVHLIRFFDRNAKIIRDYTWLETHLAKLVPMELVVQVRPELICASSSSADATPGSSVSDEADAEALGPQRLQLNFWERMEIAARIQEAVDRQLGMQGQHIVAQTLSVPTFAPELPPAGFPTFRDPVRSVTNCKLAEHRGEYLATDYLRIERGSPNAAAAAERAEDVRPDPNIGSELWRISLRVGALRDIDYGAFVGELKRVIEPVLSALLAGPLGRPCDPRRSRQAGQAASAPPVAEAASSEPPPTHAVLGAGGEFAQPHITADARLPRDGVERRHDRGHHRRGR